MTSWVSSRQYIAVVYGFSWEIIQGKWFPSRVWLQEAKRKTSQLRLQSLQILTRCLASSTTMLHSCSNPMISAGIAWYGRALWAGKLMNVYFFVWWKLMVETLPARFDIQRGNISFPWEWTSQHLGVAPQAVLDLSLFADLLSMRGWSRGFYALSRFHWGHHAGCESAGRCFQAVACHGWEIPTRFIRGDMFKSYQLPPIASTAFDHRSTL